MKKKLRNLTKAQRKETSELHVYKSTVKEGLQWIQTICIG